MAGYRLHLQHTDRRTVGELPSLGELADRVALEQLAHELNPVDPAGYVVTFTVTGAGDQLSAAGHFYVRATTEIGPTVVSRNNPG